ncbi:MULTISPECIES: YfbM family protein [Kitasatospora]|uniref:YfbM family protein n=1 Tax=Kitasatospora TaxID=2063 RepID=UPI0004C1C195|nr:MULTISPECIES: YfbM family protein [Kitasatospora]
MSMIGRYLRLSAGELERAEQDPEWVREFAEELDEDAQEGRSGGAWARLHGTGKAWQALDFLLRRREFPVDVVYGETELPGAEDWGYGPPCLITPERVRLAAGTFAELDPGRLTEGIAAADLAEARIYPHGLWSSEDALHLVTAEYRALADFLGAVATRRHGVLVWIE